MIGRVASLAALSMLSLLGIFLLQWLPVLLVGASESTDLLFASLVFHFFFAALIASNLPVIMVPVFAAERDAPEAGAYWPLCLVVGVLMLALCGLMFVSVPFLVSLLFGIYSAAALEILAELARLSLVALFFQVMSSYVAAGLQARDRYVTAEAVNAVAGVVALAVLPVLLEYRGVHGAVMALGLRWALSAVAGAALLGRFGQAMSPFNALRDLWRSYRFLLGGGLVFNLDTLVDKYLAARASTGDLTLMHLVGQAFGAVLAVTNRAITAPRLRSMSVAARRGDVATYSRVFAVTAVLVAAIGLALVIAVISARLALNWLPSFTLAEMPLERWLHAALLLVGFPAFGVCCGLFASSYYALRDTRTPTLVGVTGFAFSTVGKIIAFEAFGFTGLLIAVSASQAFNFLLYGGCLARDLPRYRRSPERLQRGFRTGG